MNSFFHIATIIFLGKYTVGNKQSNAYGNAIKFDYAVTGQLTGGLSFLNLTFLLIFNRRTFSLGFLVVWYTPLRK